MRARNIAPSSAPTNEPRPPVMTAPPRNTAAKTGSAYELPMLFAPAPAWLARTTPPRTAPTVEINNAPARIRLTLHPTRRAESARSPVARSASPRGVLYNHHSRATARSATTMNEIGRKPMLVAKMSYRPPAMMPPYSGLSQMAMPWTTPSEATVATMAVTFRASIRSALNAPTASAATAQSAADFTMDPGVRSARVYDKITTVRLMTDPIEMSNSP